MTTLGSNSRPWEPIGIGGGLFVLQRTRRGDSGAEEHYRGEQMNALHFVEADAVALAQALNAAPSVRRRP